MNYKDQRKWLTVKEKQSIQGIRVKIFMSWKDPLYVVTQCFKSKSELD